MVGGCWLLGEPTRRTVKVQVQVFYVERRTEDSMPDLGAWSMTSALKQEKVKVEDLHCLGQRNRQVVKRQSELGIPILEVMARGKSNYSKGIEVNRNFIPKLQ